MWGQKRKSLLSQLILYWGELILGMILRKKLQGPAQPHIKLNTHVQATRSRAQSKAQSKAPPSPIQYALEMGIPGPACLLELGRPSAGNLMTINLYQSTCINLFSINLIFSQNKPVSSSSDMIWPSQNTLEKNLPLLLNIMLSLKSCPSWSTME